MANIKLSHMNHWKTIPYKQIDNFRQILASMQYDVRALLIKLADRLHNMRTLSSMRADKQMKIAGECGLNVIEIIRWRQMSSLLMKCLWLIFNYSKRC